MGFGDELKMAAVKCPECGLCLVSLLPVLILVGSCTPLVRLLTRLCDTRVGCHLVRAEEGFSMIL